MNERALKKAILPLRMIFWGGLICIFDLTFSQTTNGQGFKFDILNDALGALLIAVGVFQLSEIAVHGRYSAVFKFLRVVSVLAVLDAVGDHFVVPLAPVVEFALSLFGLVTLVAIVAFCIAMRWFCEEAHLLRASRSWSVTTVLFVVIYLVPLGLFHAFATVAIVSGTSFDVQLGPAGLLLLPVFAIPLIHLFVSTSRMKRAAEAVAVVRTGEQHEANT